MKGDNATPATKQITHGTLGNSRSAYSWVLGTLLGAVLTVVLLGALVWLASGLGLGHLMSILRGGRTLVNVDQPTGRVGERRHTL